MKTFLCALLSLSALAGASAATAYEALRVVGKQKGDALLDRIVEVRGAKGVPQPASWKIVVADSKGSNGAREYEVKGSAIGGEHAQQNAGTGSSLNMNQLNLDSDGAHTVAEREAKKSGFAYDYVNYVLHPGTSAPVWEVRLVDEQNGNTAVLTMAADTGKLIKTEGLNRGSAPVAKVADNHKGQHEPYAPETPDYHPDDHRVDARRVDDGRVDDRTNEDRRAQQVNKPGNKVTQFFDRAGRHIGNAFERFGESVNRTFTGNPPARRTERRAPAPTPAPSNRDANGTEYYRPRD